MGDAKNFFMEEELCRSYNLTHLSSNRQDYTHISSDVLTLVTVRHFSDHWGSKMMKEKKSDSTFKLINMLPSCYRSGCKI